MITIEVYRIVVILNLRSHMAGFAVTENSGRIVVVMNLRSCQAGVSATENSVLFASVPLGACASTVARHWASVSP